MPGQTNIKDKNTFINEEPPEKLDPIVPPHIDPSFRNYEEGYKKAFGDKIKQKLKKHKDG